MGDFLSEIRRSSLHVWQDAKKGFYAEKRVPASPLGDIGSSLCHISSRGVLKIPRNFAKTGKPLSHLIKRNHREHNQDVHGEWMDDKAGNEKRKRIEFWPEGSLIKTGGVPFYEEYEKAGGKRGVISGFSGKSRRRMMEWVSKMKRRELPVFLTVTYPKQWPEEPDKWKKHLDRFSVNLEREFGEVCQLWKLEDQKRGAPHFHQLVWGVKFIPWQWVALEWAKVIHRESGIEQKKRPKFVPGKVGAWLFRQWVNKQGFRPEVVETLNAGVRAESIRSARGVKAYVNKYMTKQSGDLAASWGCVGRFWGVRGRKYAPESVRVVYEVSERTQKRFRRLARRFLNSMGIMGKTFGRIFADNQITWVRALDLLEGGKCESQDLTCVCTYPRINKKEQAAWGALKA